MRRHSWPTTTSPERAKAIDMKRAQDPPPGEPRAGGTIYLTTADANGMMVSYIQSNYMGFGSGVVVPGTGISMQNRGAGFSLKPGHPNLVGPGKRPFQTIIPGFLTKDGKPVMSFGVMGGQMQPQGHTQMVTRIVDYHQNPQAASDGPRWIVNNDFSVSFEDAALRPGRARRAAQPRPSPRRPGGRDVRLRRRPAHLAPGRRLLRGVRSSQGWRGGGVLASPSAGARGMGSGGLVRQASHCLCGLVRSAASRARSIFSTAVTALPTLPRPGERLWRDPAIVTAGVGRGALSFSGWRRRESPTPANLRRPRRSDA